MEGAVNGQTPPQHACLLLLVVLHCRVCLTYNLRLAGAPAPDTPTIQPDLVAHMSRLFEQWEADPQGPPFLVYMLEHRYEYGVLMDTRVVPHPVRIQHPRRISPTHHVM